MGDTEDGGVSLTGRQVAGHGDEAVCGRHSVSALTTQQLVCEHDTASPTAARTPSLTPSHPLPHPSLSPLLNNMSKIVSYKPVFCVVRITIILAKQVSKVHVLSHGLCTCTYDYTVYCTWSWTTLFSHN